MIELLASAARQLSQRKLDAAGAWRKMVESAAAGKAKKPSLEALESAGSAYGLTGEALLEAFANDVKAVQAISEEADRAEEVKRQLSRMDFKKLQQAEIDADARLREASRELGEFRSLNYIAGMKNGELDRMRQQVPRVYFPETFSNATADITELTPTAVWDGNAAWLPDTEGATA